MFTTKHDLSRCASYFNSYIAERREKTLSKVLLTQYGDNLNEVIPASIVLKLSTEIDFHSIEDMQDICDFLQCIIIFLSGSDVCPIQTLTPIKTLHNEPLLVGIGEKQFYAIKTIAVIWILKFQRGDNKIRWIFCHELTNSYEIIVTCDLIQCKATNFY